ncbi:MAG: TatD family hydrolase, partial [Muribaculaceae bacterium]|nr:TatD family hydrolase [Muribaculaceae bacterium]
MIDTHTHLYLSDFAPDGGGAAAVRRALDAGISHMVFPNVDRSTIEPLETLAGDFQDAVSTAMGLHPTEIGISWREDLQFILNHIESHPGRFCAIGEIGMDLYWDKTFADEQMKALDIQLSLAARLDLPAIIHCREALPQTIEVLKG